MSRVSPIMGFDFCVVWSCLRFQHVSMLVAPKPGARFNCAFATFNTAEEARFCAHALDGVRDASISPGFIKAHCPSPSYFADYISLSVILYG
jgi:hypothetical protein